MKQDVKIYDRVGNLLKVNDEVFDGYDTNTLEIYNDEWCISSDKSIWRIEEFVLSIYKDGIKLVDFIKEDKIYEIH